MKMFLHLIGKDWRRFRLWFVLTWTTCALTPLLPWLEPPGDRFLKFLAMAQGLAGVLALLTGARLLLHDGFSGTTQFLATRPVPRTQWIGSKLILILGALAFPLATSRILLLAERGLLSSPELFLLSAIENFIFLSFLLLILLLPALFTRNLGTMLLALLSSITVLVAVGFLVSQIFPPNRQISDPVMTNLPFLLGTVIVLMLYRDYARSRRWIRAVAIGVSGLILIFIAARMTPRISPVRPKNCRTEGDPSAAAIRLKDLRFHSGVNNGRRKIDISASLDWDTLPAPWLASPVAWKSEASWPDDTVLREEGRESLHGDPFLQRRLIGALFPSAENQNDHSRHGGFPLRLPVFAYYSDEMPTDDKPVILTGEIAVELIKPRVLGELPLTKGASLWRGESLYTIGDVRRQGDSLSVTVLVESSSASQFAPVPSSLAVGITILDQSTREPLTSGSSSRSGTRFAGYVLRQIECDFPSPADPLGIADLKVVVVGHCAVAGVLPFRLENVTLER